MRHAGLRLVLALLVLAGDPGAVASATQSQTPGGDGGRLEVPRLPDGGPDLQGIWTNATITPLERPREMGERRFLTDDEVRQLESRTAARRAASDERAASSTSVGNYNSFWLDQGDSVLSTRQTSLVVDPPDGRVRRSRADLQGWRRRHGGADGRGGHTRESRAALSGAGNDRTRRDERRRAVSRRRVAWTAERDDQRSAQLDAVRWALGVPCRTRLRRGNRVLRRHTRLDARRGRPCARSAEALGRRGALGKLGAAASRPRLDR